MSAAAPEPVFVASSWTWTGVVTVKVFAAQVGCEATRAGDRWRVGGRLYRVRVVYRDREPRCALFEEEGP